MTFSLPTKATGLREIDPSLLDLRTDSEIIAKLQTFQPITSEKNVWAIWDNGFERMYPTHQQTVLNWVRRLGPSWTVRLVDFKEGSPNNIYNYVGKEWFPECFINKTMDGKHAPQHAADLARLPLVYTYGGFYLDVSNMLHTHLDTLFWDQLSSPDSPYEMGVWIITGQIRNKWGDFGNYLFAAHRTRNLVDVETGWNGREFWENKVFMVEGIQNGILGALKTNLCGQKQIDLFTTRLDEPDLEKRAEAEEFVIEMLEKSHMYKVYHNSMAGLPALGDLIKKKENEDVTFRPGTFGELYRYGTVHWEATRKVERLEPQRNGDDLIHGTPTRTAASFKH
ncbi:hypothetical protein HYE68_003798 [Fusarium pseudograminearum]|nr:hypothetical protein HYE68_003798 [Fusarium pseudograminearum]